jgi:outer membrane protein assembly factor BamB
VTAVPPVIDSDGRTFVGHAGGVDLYDARGALVWTVYGDDPMRSQFMHVWSAPALSADGVLVVSDTSGAINGVKDGAVTWTVHRQVKDTGSALFGAVAIGADGTIFAGTLGLGLIYAIR